MNRRMISVLVIVTIVMSSLLAGCGQAATPTGPVKVVYWRSLTGAKGEVQDELVKQFNESQDKVEVDVQFQGAYGELVEKLLAALAADEVPDIVLLDSPFVVLFAKDGVLAPLDDLAKPTFNTCTNSIGEGVT